MASAQTPNRKRVTVRRRVSEPAVERDHFFGVPVVACPEFTSPTLTAIGRIVEKTS